MNLKQYLENKKTLLPYRIWQDMDGCLTAFDHYFRKYNSEGLSPEEFETKYGKGAIWTIIPKLGAEYWANMPWKEDGKELWDYIKKYNPTILSAPSKDDSSKIGKKMWCEKNIKLPNYDIQTKAKHGWDGTSKIVLNSDKWRYCEGPHDILIDDTAKKINAWVNAGGTGILHTSAAKTIQELKNLGL